MNYFIYSAAALFLLTGCAASSVKDIQEHNIYSESYTLSENYLDVYRRAIDELSRCNNSNIIDGELYAIIQKADIRFIIAGDIWALIQLEAINDEETKVDNYVYWSSWVELVSRLKSFLLEDTPTCQKWKIGA